jgi:thymidylate synthase
VNRVFEGTDFDSIYINLCGALLGDPDFKIMNKDGHELGELINPTIVLHDPSLCIAMSRKLSLTYLEGEIKYYLSGSPWLKDIAKYSKFWNTVSDDGLTINSNYGRLLLHARNSHNLTQYEYAKSCLEKNIESKKAVMVIYNAEHSRKSNDNPCTMYLQFLYRDNALNLLVKMRSSDIWFGMPYDVPFFSLILHMMAEDLGVPVGQYIHNSGSLHYYARNESAIGIASVAEPAEYQEQREIFQSLWKYTVKQGAIDE